MFPEMILLHSNHSSLIYRRALKHSMPKAYLKSYNDFLEVGKGWEWVDDLNIKLSSGQECFFTHGISADGLKLAMQYGKHVTQGHFHSKFNIQYFSNPDNLVWSMQVGCLTNQKHMAFNYSRQFRLRFIIGCGMIINGWPVLIPMLLDRDGKWIGGVGLMAKAVTINNKKHLWIKVEWLDICSNSALQSDYEFNKLKAQE